MATQSETGLAAGTNGSLVVEIPPAKPIIDVWNFYGAGVGFPAP